MSALRELRRSKGLSMEALAQLIGTTASQINKLEKGQRRLTDEWLVRLAQALDCKPSDLIDTGVFKKPKVEHEGSNHVLLPECSLSQIDEDGPAAGLGHFLDYAAFRADWLQSFADNSHAEFVAYVVEGDSMEPTLRTGDHVLVKLTADQGQGDGIYLIKVRSGLAIKRVVFSLEGDTLKIINDNPAYPAHERIGRSNVILVGRVIWVGHRI